MHQCGWVTYWSVDNLSVATLLKKTILPLSESSIVLREEWSLLSSRLPLVVQYWFCLVWVLSDNWLLCVHECNSYVMSGRHPLHELLLCSDYHILSAPLSLVLCLQLEGSDIDLSFRADDSNVTYSQHFDLHGSLLELPPKANKSSFNQAKSSIKLWV